MDRQTALKNTIQLIDSAHFTLTKEWTINPNHLDTYRTIVGHYVRILRGQDSSYSMETEDDGNSFTHRYEHRDAIGRLDEYISIVYDYNYDDAQSVSVFHTRWNNGKRNLKINWDLNSDRDSSNKLYFIGLSQGELNECVWAYKYNKPFDY